MLIYSSYIQILPIVTRSEQSLVSRWGTAFQVWNNTASPADLVTLLWCCLAELCSSADLQNINMAFVEDLDWVSGLERADLAFPCLTP